MGRTWDVKHITTEAQLKAGKEAIAKDDFSCMFTLVCWPLPKGEAGASEVILPRMRILCK